MKRTAVFIMLMMLLACGGAARADEQALQDETTQREAALKMKKSRDLLAAARRIIDNTDSDEAKALLEAAQTSFNEAVKEFGAGEHGHAVKRFSDSIQTTIDAVLLSSGPHKEGVRDLAMEEMADAKAEHDQDKMEAQLKKVTSEVNTFMAAAEKLVSESGVPSPSLEKARELYDSSMMKSGEGNYDAALRDMTAAYGLVTAIVKELKRAEGEALTFPEKQFTDPRELLAYEIEKNDTYAFFASKTAGDNGKDSLKLLRAARKARDQAQRSIDKGDGAKAIERLRQSTELYLKAIRESGE